MNWSQSRHMTNKAVWPLYGIITVSRVSLVYRPVPKALDAGKQDNLFLSTLIATTQDKFDGIVVPWATAASKFWSLAGKKWFLVPDLHGRRLFSMGG